VAALSSLVRFYETPSIRRVLRLAAVLGVLLGVETTVLHATTDPLADLHAYYDAGARLNDGQPLYEQAASTDDPSFYRYPPLLAIAFRPLALLPFEAAAAIWMAILVAAVVATFWRLGPTEPVLLVAGWLALPFMWALTVGQAQILVTALLAFGAPWAVAIAANLKLFPLLVAVYWVARREWRPLWLLAAWMIGLIALQLVLEPAGTVAYLGFLSVDQVGDVNSISPFEISPILWVILVIACLIVAIRLAPTRYGWAAAVTLAVFATPRLLAYQLSTLLAGLGGPGRGPNRPNDRP
jgi:hypothetical protein